MVAPCGYSFLSLLTSLHAAWLGCIMSIYKEFVRSGLGCRRMQALVAKEKEPITPFLAKIGALRERGVSCILVMGGSGDYFGVSDAVVCMDNYSCRDVTAEALAIDERFGASAAAQDSGAAYGSVTPRCPVSIYPGSPAGQPC